jgi:transketolase
MGAQGDNIAAAVAALAARAKAIRRNVIRQARPLGQGYVGQGLQSAELFATLYFSELRGLDLPVGDPGRDRLLLSVGHYAIGLYATLVELGHLPGEALETYAAEGSALTMGTEPGEIDSVEFAGGSLGQGLGVAAGTAMGLAYRKAGARVFNYMSDGEVQEGSTWEAAMFAGHRRLGNLVNIIDVNRTQADGPLVIEIEPLAEKFRSFGWWAMDVNGNDLAGLVTAFAAAAAVADQPKCLICHTRLGYGSPTVMNQTAAHFVRVEAEQWDVIAQEVERNP